MKTVLAVLLLATAPIGLTSANPPGVSDWELLDRSNDPRDKKLATEVVTTNVWRVCAEWGRLYRSNKDARREGGILSYLEFRGMLNKADKSHVGDQSVAIGMTECGVYAAKGLPSAVNQTDTANDRRSQLVYGRLYVYTNRQGIVEAVQQ